MIVDFSLNRPSARIRPALVVQNDRDNSRTTQTIVVQITTNLSRAGIDTQVSIDSSNPDWAKSGLRAPSVINCSRLASIDTQDILRTIGNLSPATLQQIDDCLRSVLDLK